MNAEAHRSVHATSLSQCNHTSRDSYLQMMGMEEVPSGGLLPITSYLGSSSGSGELESFSAQTHLFFFILFYFILLSKAERGPTQSFAAYCNASWNEHATILSSVRCVYHLRSGILIYTAA